MPPAVVSSLSVLALLLALGAIVLATIANRRWARRERRYVRDRGPGESADGRTGDPRAELDGLRTGLDGLRTGLDGLRTGLDDLRTGLEDVRTGLEDVRTGHPELRSGLEDVRSLVAALAGRLDAVAAQAQAAGMDPTALRHVAVVRYDAFADVGGRLSYSVALVDDTRSGLVLTTLAGKSDVRTYVRAISGGRSDGTLTAEEQQALDAAGRLE